MLSYSSSLSGLNESQDGLRECVCVERVSVRVCQSLSNANLCVCDIL